MKRYLFFQSPESDFELQTPIFVLCGSPRTVQLNPISNASLFFWEQLQPDPIAFPISFSPNNTSKNLLISIPNNINTTVVLKVTINGNPDNFRIIRVNVNLIDFTNQFNTGTGFIAFDNTLKDAPIVTLVPIPTLGSQAINYINNTQSTGITIARQFYRNTFTKSVDILNSNNTLLTTINLTPKSIYDFSSDTNRVSLNVNTQYNTVKNWDDIKINNGTNISPLTINITYPSIIADEIVKSSFNTGTGYISFNRQAFLVQNQSYEESINTQFSTGTGYISFNRQPFLVQNQSYDEVINTTFNTGTGYITFIRTPFTTNIVG